MSTPDPGLPSQTPRTVEEKIAQLREQQALLSSLRERAASGGDRELGVQADALQRQYHAREMAGLAADVYNAASHTGQPPPGWLRGSEHPELLRQAGINWSNQRTDQLLQPDDSAFRAEVYLPDPRVYGPEVRPVLSYKGSNGPVVFDESGRQVTRESAPEDWMNNGRQGLGLESDYYTRAMTLARELRQSGVQEKFEIVGHSLGGGMASAGSAVTGVPTTTFNAAGLHQTTAQRFADQNGLRVHNPNQTVAAYQVTGEVLTDVQTSIDRMNGARRAELGRVANQASELLRLPGARELMGQQLAQHLPYSREAQADARGLVDALATQNGSRALRDMPLAAGQVQPLLTPKTRDAQGSLVDRPQAMSLGQAGEFAGPLLRVASVSLAGAQAGRQVGEVVATGGRVVDRGLDAAGDGARVSLQMTGRAAQAGSHTVGQVVGWQVRAGGEATAQVQLVRGQAAAGVDMVQCKAAEWSNSATSSLLRGAGRWVPMLNDIADRNDRATSQYCETQRGQARAAIASSQQSAHNTRAAAQHGAQAIEQTADAAGARVRRAADGAGHSIDATLDATGYQVRRTTSYAPLAGALTGATVSGLAGTAVTFDPTHPSNWGNIARTKVLFDNIGQAAGEAVQRHGMVETVLPSMDFRTREMERAALSRAQTVVPLPGRDAPVIAPANPGSTPDTRGANTQGGDGVQLNDPRHNQYPLYRGAADGVYALDARHARASDGRSDQLAGALTVAAMRSGMQEIHHVELSRDASRVFAVQGRLDDPARLNASVETARGMDTPLRESTQRANEIEAARAPAQQAQQQTQDPAQEQQNGERAMRRA
ncbi:XVIPCD domain-containing protein [Lysobacter silvisoli]|uniref:Phospholipase n=1 Tax=Lysobacter silvisoli TaxID=2293254 RepID=A0A371K4R3_9GAMM|nr:XVIPCD domain-containing protein [Lysobacter silvisoli]RDZ28916.1 phospholipase [Lysobacter silvisoli]